jgi:hypothetical protein
MANPALVLLTLASVLAGFGDKEGTLKRLSAEPRFGVKRLGRTALRIRCTNPESKQRDNNECRQKSIELAKAGNALLLDYNQAHHKLTKSGQVSSLILQVNTVWVKSWDFSGPKVSRFQVLTLV